MIVLILGVLVWAGAHVFARAMPDARASMTQRMGKASKGVIAAVLVLSVVLMVIGYRAAPFVPVWTPPPFLVHVNNLLMLAAVALFGLGSSKSRLRGRLKHPMLSGFITWTVAHLLVNGDFASILLFGGLLIWAIAEIVILNRTTPRPEPFAGGSLAGDVRLAVITLLVFVVITAVHAWLGVWPFPG